MLETPPHVGMSSSDGSKELHEQPANHAATGPKGLLDSFGLWTAWRRMFNLHSTARAPGIRRCVTWGANPAFMEQHSQT